MNRMFAIIVSMVCLFAAPVVAEDVASQPETSAPKSLTTAEKRLRKEAEDKLAKQSLVISKNCGADISVKVDWTNFSGEEADLRLVGTLCSDALGALKTTCRDQLGKDAVKEKINSFTCSFDSARALSLSEGKFELKLDTKAKNYSDFVSAWLRKNI